MAAISLQTNTASTQSGNTDVRLSVENSIEQHTYDAGVALEAGTPVYLDTNGVWQKASSAAANAAARVRGITVKKVAAGFAVTAISQGILAGFDFTNQAYGAPIYLNDTAGVIGDAAGTVSILVGYVIPGPSQGRGVARKKMLLVKV